MAFKISQNYFKQILTGQLQADIGAMDAQAVDFLIGTSGEISTAGSVLSGRLALIGRSQNTHVKLFDPDALPSTAMPLSFPSATPGKDTCVKTVLALLSLMWPIDARALSLPHPAWNVSSATTYAFNLFDSVTTLQQLNNLVAIHFSAIAWFRSAPWNEAWYYTTTNKKDQKRFCCTSISRPPVKYKYIFGFNEETALVPLRAYTTNDGVPETPYVDPDDTAKHAAASWILESALWDDEDTKDGDGYGRRGTTIQCIPGSSDAARKVKTYYNDYKEDLDGHFWVGDNRPIYSDAGRDNNCRLHRAYLGAQPQPRYLRYKNAKTYSGEEHGNELAFLYADVEPLMGMETLWSAVVSTALCQICGTDVLTRLEDYIDGGDTSLIENPIQADAIVPVLLAAWVNTGTEWQPQTYMNWIEAPISNPDNLKDEPLETYHRYAKRHSSGKSGSMHEQQNGIEIRYTADNTVWGASSLNRNLVMVYKKASSGDEYLTDNDIELVGCRWPNNATLSSDTWHSWKWGMDKAYGPHLGGFSCTDDIDDYFPSEAVLERPCCSVLIPWGSRKVNNDSLTKLWTTSRAFVDTDRIARLMMTNEPTVLTIINATDAGNLKGIVKGAFVRNNVKKLTTRFAMFTTKLKNNEVVRCINDIGGFYV